MSELEREIAAVLNKYSCENASNTPDFILAQFLGDCLNAYNAASAARAKWYGAAQQAKIQDMVGSISNGLNCKTTT